MARFNVVAESEPELVSWAPANFKLAGNNRSMESEQEEVRVRFAAVVASILARANDELELALFVTRCPSTEPPQLTATYKPAGSIAKTPLR